MASSITSAGAASGMDFESIISASLEAKRAQLERQTTTQKEEANIELSGVGQLKSALETFQKALQAFTEDNAFNARKVTIDQPEDTKYFTVEAEEDASNMQYDVIVEQLASTEKISKNFTIGENENQFQAGTLTFNLGKRENEDGQMEDVSFTIDIEEGDSLELIRRKINENDYGDANNALTITETPKDASDDLVDADGNKLQSLDAFNFAGGTTTPDAGATTIGGWNYTKAQDAVITLDGQEVRSESNVFDEQISGITLTVNRVSEKDDKQNFISNTLKVEEDYDAVATKMQNFVSAYNTLMSTMDSLYEHNTYTDGENNYDGGYLAGDSMLRSLQTQIQQKVSSAGMDSKTGQSIYSMGLEFEQDGTLSLDSTAFKEALTDSYNLVVNAFSGDDGLLKQLDTFIEDYTESQGILDQRKDQLNSEISDLEAEELENELSQAAELKELCARAEKTAVTFESIDPSLISSDSFFFHKKGESIMKLDKIYNAEKKAEKVRELLCLAAGLGAFLLSIIRRQTEEASLWFTIVVCAVVAALIICFFVLWYRSYRR